MSRVVVVGGGFAGSLAAIALSERYDEVVLIERDASPTEPIARRGVRQGAQLHNLLGRAQKHLDELVPGFLDALREAGCGHGHASVDTIVFELGIDMPRRHLDVEIYSAPRPIIDLVLSRFGPKVALRDATTVTGLLGTRDHVTGVSYQGPDGSGSIDGDLVIDASGVSSLAGHWLAERGTAAPRTDLDVDQWYVSSVVELASSADDGKFTMVFPHGLDSRGALLSPAGDGTYYLSLSGRSHDVVPRDFSEVLAFASTLGASSIASRLHGSRLVSGPNLFRKVVATWRRFDQVAMPKGLVVIGDSVAALNPLFGQGMSVAAWQVSTLVERDQGTVGWHPSFAAVAAGIVGEAWSLGRVVSDAIVGPDGVDLTAALAAEIRADAALHARYVRMWHLLEPASFLGSPEITDRLLRRNAALLIPDQGADRAAGPRATGAK